MQKFLQFAAIAYTFLAPQILAKWLSARNECPFDVWCAGAKNDGTFTPSTKISQGQTYRSELTADDNNIGAVLKCALDPYIQQPYQMEVTVRRGLTWLDLSAVNGDPFLDYHRHAEINGVSRFHLSS
ncbi:hypothetical protein F5Y12DRAFT_795353 [Xylaria sp. FL1777]|nr:hypothetical protein F5Y12DRAFT_795353 [Xylaria sp. FL1777]